MRQAIRFVRYLMLANKGVMRNSKRLTNKGKYRIRQWKKAIDYMLKEVDKC